MQEIIFSNEKNTSLYNKKYTLKEMKDHMNKRFFFSSNNERVFKMKVPYHDGKFNVRILDTDRKIIFDSRYERRGKLPFNEHGKMVSIVMDLHGIYQLNERWGYSANVNQAMLSIVNESDKKEEDSNEDSEN